jgi:hypothetical protein
MAATPTTTTTHGDLPEWVMDASRELARMEDRSQADGLSDCLTVLASCIGPTPFSCTYRIHMGVLSVSVNDDHNESFLWTKCATLDTGLLQLSIVDEVVDIDLIEPSIGGEVVENGRGLYPQYKELLTERIQYRLSFPWLSGVRRVLAHDQPGNGWQRDQFFACKDAIEAVLCRGKITIPRTWKHYVRALYNGGSPWVELRLYFPRGRILAITMYATPEKVGCVVGATCSMSVLLAGNGWSRRITEPTSNNMTRGLADLAALLEEGPKDSHSLLSS